MYFFEPKYVFFKNSDLEKFITILDSLINLPLNIDYSPESHREGLATYFRAYLQEFMNKWLRENPNSDGSKYNLKISYSDDGDKLLGTGGSIKKACKLIDENFFI